MAKKEFFKSERTVHTTRAKAAAQQYQFPPLVVGDDRSELITNMIPGLITQRKFNKWGVIDGINVAADTAKSDTRLMRSMLEAMGKANLYGVADLKKFILKFGLTEKEVHQRVHKSWNHFLKEHPTAYKKQHIIGILSKMRRSHYLILVGLSELWTSLVTDGCFCNLVRRQELLSLIEFSNYKDISEFISHRLGSYDWERHCPSSTNGVPESRADAELRESITAEMRACEYECIVCFDPIIPSHEFWQCDGCYRVIHLECLRGWHAASGKSECPTCRRQHTLKEIKFRCWCKRVPFPRPDKLLPGSCGKTCGRPIPGTNEECTLTCHPGPHSKK